MKISTAVLTVIVFTALSTSAQATLMVIDDELVYDSKTSLYFQRDWLAYRGGTYNEMRASIDNSTTGGFTDWRLASTEELFASTIWDYGQERVGLHPTIFATIFEPSSAASVTYWEGYTALYQPSTFVGFGGEAADYDIQTAFLAAVYSPTLAHDAYGWNTFHMSWHRTNDQLNSRPLHYGAWVVSPGSQAIPEPAALLVFGVGLVGLVGSKLRRKGKKIFLYSPSNRQK